MASDGRSWMDNRLMPNCRGITEEFYRGVKHFIDFAKQHLGSMGGNKMRCPCPKCKNIKFCEFEMIEKHLLQHGFIDNYKRWIYHGEEIQRTVFQQFNPTSTTMNDTSVESEDEGMEDMVRDAAGHNFDWSENYEEEPNVAAKKFYDVLKAARKPLYAGSDRTLLETVVEYLSIKSNNNMSQACYNQLMAAAKRSMPKDNCMVSNFYETKNLVKQLGLSYLKIDVCKNQCMLFFKENENKMICDQCHASRYKPRRRGSAKRKTNIPWKVLRYMPLIPRLQRLYASKGNAEAMRWHKESPREPGVLVHPSDGEAWKHFDALYPEYAFECRNVRLGICADGFNPHGPGSRSYSCWPVIVTPYNLPPWLCMNDPFMFCTLLIPGPHSPGKSIDVFLQPLIDELNLLWSDGVETWDAYKKQNFSMRASVMWTINDFPAYGMLSGWSTHGKMACPYCMEDIKSFNLPHSKKACWFDCHRRFLPLDHPFRRQKLLFTRNREDYDEPPELLTGEQLYGVVSTLPNVRFGRKFAKEHIAGFGVKHKWTKRSIFWELPYWKSNLIRHNLDVMHIEKNVFDNIFNTVMDFKGTSKDTVKGRMDLKEICKRSELELVQKDGKLVKPVAQYVLSKEDKLLVLEWFKTLKLPDGYSSNIGNSVNLEELKMQGLKSHDCHVILDRLLPIALRGLLPDHIWIALTELSEFFRALTSSTLRVEDMEMLEKSIVVTLCKLEKIFPPSFFDSMEHLPVHLAYEAKVGGPVQYRWMYPFERFLGKLKRKMSNRAMVEASIAETIVIDEIVAFVANYHEGDVQKSLARAERNYDGGDPPCNDRLSVFAFPGRVLGKKSIKKRMLTLQEFSAARNYVLLNCDEVGDYLDMFESEAGDISLELIQERTDREFAGWLKQYILDHPEDLKAQKLKVLAADPYLQVNCYKGYKINGYVFHTSEYGENKKTWNSGVNLRGNIDYYGVLKEVLELQYRGNDSNIVLFNVDWRDATRGIRKHPTLDLVDVKYKSKHLGDDVFIFASQAQQIYMTPYPNRRHVDKGWWATWKCKARSQIHVVYALSSNHSESSLDECYQEDEMPIITHVSPDDEQSIDDAMPNQYEDVAPIELIPLPNVLDIVDDDEEEVEVEHQLEPDDDDDEEVEAVNQSELDNDSDEEYEGDNDDLEFD